MSGVIHGLLASLRSAVATVTATVTDTFFRYVSLLLNTTNTNGAQNNTFRDSSTNNFSITRNGNVTQGTFSPFSQTGWSGFFDGTGDYLTAPDNAAFEFGSGNFTVEMWYYPLALPTDVRLVSKWNSGTVVGTNQWLLFLQGAVASGAFSIDGTNAAAVITGPNVVLNQWNHIAFVRNGTSFTVYTNGVAGTPATNAGSLYALESEVLGIGYSRNSIGSPVIAMNGYASQVRIVKGTAVYTANFTPPTTPLTAITNTSLLTCQSNRFIDRSTNNFAITRNGDTAVKPFSPFAPSTPQWGSYFDGNGDWLTIPDNNAFEFGNGDLTAEAWIYLTGYSSAVSGSAVIFAKNINDSNLGFYLVLGGTSFSFTTLYWLQYYSGTTAETASGSFTFNLNTWYHVAATKSSGSVRLFVNGVQVNTTATFTQTQLNSAASVTIGGQNWPGNTYELNGYISNARLVKGTAVYTSNFTPSTAPLTAIANTSLLTCQNNTFIDNSSNNFTVTVSGNAVPQPFSPFAPITASWNANTNGGSGYFDGTGDFLSSPNSAALQLGSSNFTIEFWYYPSSLTGTRQIINTIDMFGENRSYSLVTNGTTAQYNLASVTGVWDIASSVSIGTVQLNAWNHFVLVRNGNTFTPYLNGIAGTTTTSSLSLFNFSTSLLIGMDQHLNQHALGYISNLRIVKGTAVYTANFTPPTTPLTAITNTSLLLNFTNAGIFDSSSRLAVETVGANSQVSTAVSKWAPSSILFSSSWLQLPASTELNFGTGDFTIEFWMYPTQSGGGTPYSIILDDSGGGSTISIQNGSAGPVNSRIWFGAGSATAVSATIPPANTWTHVACVRSGQNLYTFLNGVLAGQGTGVGAGVISCSGGRIGKWSGNSLTDNCYIGYLDDFRITKGIARYGPVVPTSALTVGPQTALLLTTNTTNGTQNNTFLDSSANNFSITRNGDTTQGSFTPYMPSGYWSGFFDGTGDDLRLSTNAAFALGTGDFTFDVWINPSNWTNPIVPFFAVSGTGGFWVGKNGSNFVVRAFGVADQLTYGTLPTVGAWTHIVAVRSGTTLSMYYNGTRVATTTNSYNFAQAALGIGSDADAIPSYYTGYISNARLVKGTAVYDPTLTTLTVPTTPLTAITNTSLLCLQDNRFIDRSTNAFAITRNGDTRISKFAPFNPPASYSTASYGGSGYFDGTGDYLAVQASTAFNIGAGDFTVESWVYPTVTANGAINSQGNGGLSIWLYSGSITVRKVGVSSVLSYAGLPATNTWSHVAVVRSGTTLSIFLNGARVATVTNSTDFSPNTTNGPTIGFDTFTGLFTGYFSNVRMVVGSAVYDPTLTTLTVPTTPLTAITNTSLLLNFTNAGIFDAATINDGQTVGNAQVSTTQAKWSPTSMAFDGTGDAIVLPRNAAYSFGGDFTIECWVYYSTSALQALFDTRNTDSVSAYLLDINASDKLDFIYGASVRVTSATSIPKNQWAHVAVARSSGTIRLFINGALDANTASTSAAINAASFPSIGGGRYLVADSVTGYYLNGYIQDLRITNGVALYTNTFTPPTAAFPTQ
jgi:hypothetical protein